MKFWCAPIKILIILFSKISIFLLYNTNKKQKFVDMASCSLCQQLQSNNKPLQNITADGIEPVFYTKLPDSKALSIGDLLDKKMSCRAWVAWHRRDQVSEPVRPESRSTNTSASVTTALLPSMLQGHITSKN